MFSEQVSTHVRRFVVFFAGDFTRYVTMQRLCADLQRIHIARAAELYLCLVC